MEGADPCANQPIPKSNQATHMLEEQPPVRAGYSKADVDALVNTGSKPTFKGVRDVASTSAHAHAHTHKTCCKFRAHCSCSFVDLPMKPTPVYAPRPGITSSRTLVEISAAVRQCCSHPAACNSSATEPESCSASPKQFGRRTAMVNQELRPFGCHGDCSQLFVTLLT
jgi:hypothetical protein